MKRMWDESEIVKIAKEHGGELTPEELVEIIKGSDTISVDISEQGDTVVVKLDQDVIDEIDSKADDFEPGAGLQWYSGEVEDKTLIINFDDVQEKLTAGDGIDITNGVISVSFSEAESEDF